MTIELIEASKVGRNFYYNAASMNLKLSAELVNNHKVFINFESALGEGCKQYSYDTVVDDLFFSHNIDY